MLTTFWRRPMDAARVETPPAASIARSRGVCSLMAGSITQRDSVVNTHRVRRESRPVNNGRMPFHLNLRRLRKAKGLNQEQLAHECGWGQSRIANYEADPSKKGARKPAIDDIPIIATALGVGIQELFDLPTAPSQPARPDRDTLVSALAALAQINEMQVGERFALNAHNILVAYEEVSDSNVDLNEIAMRIASRLRGSNGEMERGKVATTG